jgi:hypothetical protein
MEKNTKKIIAGALAVLGIYLIYRYYKKPKDATSTTPVEPPPVYVPSTDPKDSYPLKKGSKGANVESLQKLLLKIDSTLLPKFGADGDFGSETEAAVKKLLNKVTVDGNDYAKLLNMYNQKAFPLIVGNPKKDSGVPMFKPPFGF